AFAKRSQTVKMHTRTIPPAKTSREDVQALKERYAMALLKPRVVDVVDLLETPAAESTGTQQATQGITTVKRLQRAVPLAIAPIGPQEGQQTRQDKRHAIQDHKGSATGSHARRSTWSNAQRMQSGL